MKKDEYVLATKYRDGDPHDHWGVGFYDREEDGRHYVIDEHGNQLRVNGFRRVIKISPECGAFLLNNANMIGQSSCSMWGWKQKFKEGVQIVNCHIVPDTLLLAAIDSLKLHAFANIENFLDYQSTTPWKQAMELETIMLTKPAASQ